MGAEMQSEKVTMINRAEKGRPDAALAHPAGRIGREEIPGEKAAQPCTTR